MAADLNGHFQIQLVQKADQPLLAEPMKARAHERGHFRLLDAEPFRGFRLRVAFLGFGDQWNRKPG
jgi:hypothetical protein